MTGPYLTSKAAAEALGIGRSTLYRWADAGYITPAIITPAGHPRWDIDDLRRQLQAKPRPGEPMTDPAAPLRPAIVAAIITSNQGVLIERRHDGKPLWTFPSGEAEPGESPQDTAIRETKEETTLEIKVGHVIGERDHPATGRHMIYVAARPYHGTEVAVGDEDELAEVKWADLEEADQLLPGMFGPVRDHLFRVLN